MNELVFLQNNQALTDSLNVAKVFKKEHKVVLEAIRNLLRDLGTAQKSAIPTDYFIESEYTFEQNGRKLSKYLMTRDGFTLLAMGFTGKKALKFKLDYIQAFNAMEQKIIELLAERKSEEWRAIRQAGKHGNKKMCAAVHDVIIPLARLRGSVTPDDKFYMTYQKAVNKVAGITLKSRDELPLGQLYEVEKLQSMVDVSIRGLAARGEEDYKQIYRNTKQTLENYSRLSLISERFLPA